jgi:lipopolysaccharide/colanic/teichoic acid biosynthesis glycosyltransferase
MVPANKMRWSFIGGIPRTNGRLATRTIGTAREKSTIRYQQGVKRAFDLFASSVGLVLLWPLILAIVWAVRITSPGPSFFRQTRIGLNGKPFQLMKFRTMIWNHSNGSTITTDDDERLTDFGKWLRKYKLDELPQLWNVIKGDMSLVGPRPDVPGYADRLKGRERAVLSVRPGITGPASIKYAREEELLGRVNGSKKYNDEVIFPDKVRINLEYIESWNFHKDIFLILRTLVNSARGF